MYRFGRADLTGSGVGEEEPEGGGDYLEWGPRSGSFPRQATLPVYLLCPGVAVLQQALPQPGPLGECSKDHSADFPDRGRAFLVESQPLAPTRNYHTQQGTLME